jgi:PAS domain S-box-containing protein
VIKSWNKGAEALYGWKEKEVIGKSSLEIIPTKYVSGMERTDVEEALSSKGYWQGEVVQKKKNGEQVNILAVLSQIKDSIGAPVGIVAVNRDITDRKMLEQRKDDFVAVASHELKTPVTSLKLFAQVLQKRFEKIDDKQSAKLLLNINFQLTKLTDLVNSLLDISRVQQGKLTYKKEIFMIDELVRETVENIQNISERHQIVVRGQAKVKIDGDRDRIAQVLTNLLTNAIKYSPKATKVIVDISKGASNIKICVTDYGRGILKSEQNKIFERFYQINDAEVKTYPGLGLGLYISREIAERHGGKISVKSVEGKGSTFCLSLPLKTSKKRL